MRILVTGGRGLLGSAVVTELLHRGHNVLSFQRSPSGTDAHDVLGDITDPSAVAAAMRGADAVVHLAALVSMSGPLSDFERVNVGGTQNVIAAAQAAGVGRFVHVSSPSVAHVGRALVGDPGGRAEPDHARGHYARTKAVAELLALAADSEGMAVTSIRPHLVWGPGDTQLIARIAQRARAGRLFLIDHGAALIDSTYVDNAAEAIAQALDRATLPEVRGRAFVVTNGQPRTVAEMLGRIAAAAGCPAPRRSVPASLAKGAGSAVERAWSISGRAGEPPITRFIAEQLSTAHWFDQRLTCEALDWHPRIPLDEGFRRLREWLESLG
jgi:nucleoside-diphosphate-sugar epimerase